MTAPGTQPEVSVRSAAPEDGVICGQICYDAFATISDAHGFPRDFPVAEIPIGLLSMMFSKPDWFGVVAESAGRIVGSNVLDERSVIAGVGPITIDPAVQNLGVGRKLMEAVMNRAIQRGAAGVRFTQAGFHNRSLALYASHGFDVREPLSCMQGRTAERNIPGCAVQQATSDDVGACNLLSRRVHGFDRSVELEQAIEQGTACVVERGDGITGYTTHLAFFGHSTAETNVDLQALIASADSFAGPGLLVPTRNHRLFRWCLANGLRVVQPLTLMSVGFYNEPSGAWLPSVIF
jgi:GNAT superfamily N-acetyltransferase